MRNSDFLRLFLMGTLFWFVASAAVAQEDDTDGLSVFGKAGDIHQPQFAANGVDPVTGTFSTATRGIAIGTPGNGGLFFQRTYNSGRKAAANNYPFSLRWTHNLHNGISKVDGFRFNVSLEGQTYAFDSSFNELSASGASLVDDASIGETSDGSYVLTTGDGTVAYFDKKFKYDPVPGDGLKVFTLPTGFNAASLTKIERPNGEVVNYHYRYYDVPAHLEASVDRHFYRLQSVTNNFGYQIHLEYFLNDDIQVYDKNRAPAYDPRWNTIHKAKAINNGVDACAPTATVCSGLTENWPSETYEAAIDRILFYTDSEGYTTAYAYSGVTGVPQYKRSLITFITQPDKDGAKVDACAAGLESGAQNVNTATCGLQVAIGYTGVFNTDDPNAIGGTQNTCVEFGSTGGNKVREDCTLYVNNLLHASTGYARYTRELTISDYTPSNSFGVIYNDDFPNTELVTVINLDRNGQNQIESRIDLNVEYRYDDIKADGNPTGVRDRVVVNRLREYAQSNALLKDELFEYYDGLSEVGKNFGKLKSFTDAEGIKTAYEFTDRGFANKITTSAKPGSGLADIVISAHYPANCTSQNRKTCNKPTWIRDAKLNETNYSYSGTHGGVTSVRQPDAGDGRPEARTFYTLLPDADGNNTIYFPTLSISCSTGAFVGSISNAPTNPSNSAHNCADGQEVKVLNETIFGTSGNNLLKPVTVETRADTLISTTQSTYDAKGDVIAIDGPKAGTVDKSYFFYDDLRRQIGKIGPDPDGSGGLMRFATRTSYHPYGGEELVETGNTNYTGINNLNAAVAFSKVETQYYDGNGVDFGLPKATIEYQDSSPTIGGLDPQIIGVVHVSYDDLGRVDCSAQRMNPANFGAALPQSACTHMSEGQYGPDRISKTIYTEQGEVHKVINAFGVTGLQQDTRTHTYTANGLVETIADANGNKTKYEYDGFDRLERQYFPSKTATGQHNTSDYEQYGYDANGNRISLRKRDGQTITYDYDDLNRVEKKIIPGPDVFYVYDQRGLLLESRFGSLTGQGIINAFDGLGRLKSSNNTLIQKVLTHSYDIVGNRTKLTHPDGLHIDYTYDELDRLRLVKRPGGGMISRFDYQRDGFAWRIARPYGANTELEYDRRRLSNFSHAFAGTAHDLNAVLEYNPASQLVRKYFDNVSYGHVGASGSAGNYVVNGLNQYESVAGASFSHDDNGNLTSDGVYTFGYDIENRLEAVSGNGLSGSLKYDPNGRLYEVTVNGVITQFLYDGDALVAEYNGSNGQLLRTYVHGSGVDQPLIWFEGTGWNDPALRTLHTNHQGSVIAVGGSGASSLATNTYDAYGVPDASNLGRFGYTGQIALSEFGLWHYKARMYHPATGRFLQTDPIGYEDQMNLYAYVGNDPMNYVDPTGLEIALTGTDEERNKFIQTAQDLTGVPLSEQDGLLVTGDLTDVKLSNAGQVLVDAINSTTSIKIEAVSNDPNVFIDSFIKETVDSADLAGFGVENRDLGAAALTHIIAEKMFHAQNPNKTGAFRTDFPVAHEAGLTAETAVMGAASRTSASVNGIPIIKPGSAYGIAYGDSAGNLVSVHPFINHGTTGTPVGPRGLMNKMIGR